MTQGKFSKEEATATLEAVDELYKAIPIKKRPEFIGHINDICLFLEAAKLAAPSEEGARGGDEVSARA
jgi:hypothetical protein